MIPLKAAGSVASVSSAPVVPATAPDPTAPEPFAPEPSAPDVRSRPIDPRSTLIETNPYSGPIRVPGRVALGDSGLTTLPIALGTSVFGWTVGPDAAERTLDRFAALGGTLVDTADSYASGRSELMIGNWMASRRVRDRMLVATKVGRSPDLSGLDPATVIAAVDESLARLRTDRIDLLHLHGEDPSTPLAETLGAVGTLIEAGKVRAVGASDFSAELLIEARVLAANGLPRVQALTTRYSLMERAAFEGRIELVAHAQGLAVLPYFALANGYLAGQVRRRSEATQDARGARLARHLGRRGHRVLAAIDDLAFRRDVAPATVAIAWLQAKSTVSAPVVGVTEPEQLDVLMAATGLVLTRSELIELDRASA
ncbi:aldo/keto reductase [Agromyces sp. MMS24-JH15]|uniref:aldo/keto reductase n=1 Tax=Agromyces sp. MMS24-JH15 TaxID=3243765 RepID=UPI0037490812